jgi:hypothetical protein
MGSRSPRITHLSWGRLEIDGYAKPFKDAKLFPGGARAWDWNETGTRHVPGIQPADVEELLTHGARVVVLSKDRRASGVPRNAGPPERAADRRARPTDREPSASITTSPQRSPPAR